MKRKRADLQNDEMKCNCQVHGRVSVGVCWGVGGGGGLGGNRGPEGALLCLSMRQSLLKDANIFSRWLTAHRVVRSETFRQTCFSLCVFFFFYICLSRTLSGEQSSLCWPSTRSENRSNHLFIDWNIRRLRGSEGAAATKSGKDRLAGGIREGGEGGRGGGRRVAVVEGMGVKLSAEQRRGDDCWANKKGTVCLHKTTSQQTNKRQPSDGEGAERGYSSSNAVRRRRV